MRLELNLRSKKMITIFLGSVIFLISVWLVYSRMYQPLLIDNLISKNSDSINSKELANLLKNDSSKIMLFDFRSVKEYKKGHIPGAKQYDVNEDIKEENLNKNKTIIVYSQTSKKSLEVVKKLKNSGYECFYLEGGWKEGWEPYLADTCSTCGKSTFKSKLTNLIKEVIKK